MEEPAEFERLVSAVIVRLCAQLSRPTPVAQLPRFAVQLRRLLAERGLPRPLRDDENGAPGGMSEEEIAPLVASVMAGLDDPVLGDAARQLVKACWYPEFRVCRDSFREVSRDGSCRRQELARVRGRVSGAHCVDCPHWVALAPAEHADFLGREWRRDPAELAMNRSTFL